MIRPFLEQAISRWTRDGQTVFFDTGRFPWVAQVEAQWTEIRAELDTLLLAREKIPNFQDLSEDQKLLTEGDQWKTFFLYGYGHEVERNCERCPATVRVLRGIPGMKTAMFSILAPGKHIPEHRGPYKGVLRFHLGLIVPRPNSLCRIRVAGETRSWQEGKGMIFDDSFSHEVWNDADSYRVVLFVDLVRPLWFPLSILNRIMIRHIARTPFIVEAWVKAKNAAG